jgi:hydroxysqualene dehydroxylase
MTDTTSIAVIGAGWAGCAAAAELADAGYRVTLFEAARTLGGRARVVDIHGTRLDNGQHILLGAYSETLRLFKKIGLDPGACLMRLPLQMRYAPGCDGMDFITPRLPATLHLLVALLRAKGLRHDDKMALARFSTTARWMKWRLHEDCTVSTLLERFDQTERLIKLMWRPLCVAALNTPPERASAQIFLNVLRDSLGARRAASDMLIPRVDLSTLFPLQAAAFIRKNGGVVQSGSAVQRICKMEKGWSLTLAAEHEEQTFDAVVVATSAVQAESLLNKLTSQPLIPEFEYEPITTCYLQYPPGTRLKQPLFALTDDADSACWGQFVFDRGWLDPAQEGLFAVVVSASTQAIESGQDALTNAIAAQLATAFDQAHLAQPLWSRVISEKRATFSCTPALQRPSEQTEFPRLTIAGDYLDSDYPATLESATRSGVKAARLLCDYFGKKY